MRGGEPVIDCITADFRIRRHLRAELQIAKAYNLEAARHLDWYRGNRESN
jgi:hypothetical protein